MRISDWSSDVCSSDLKGRAQPLPNPLRLPIRHIFGAPKGEMFQTMSETKLAILLHQRSHVDADADRYLTGRNTVVAIGITQAIVQFAEQPRRIYGNIAALVEPGRGPRGWGSSGFARLTREHGRHPRQHQSHRGDRWGGAPCGNNPAEKG